MTASHTAVLLSFPDPDRCRAAFAEAKHLPGLRQAVILARSEEGEVAPLESYARGAVASALGASVLGGLVGLLAGPAGAVVGFTAGAALATTAEGRREVAETPVLIVLSTRVDEGAALLVLEMHESSPDPVDEFAARHAVTPERIPAEELAEQVRAAENAATTEE
jgi:hypothetical protein